MQSKYVLRFNLIKENLLIFFFAVHIEIKYINNECHVFEFSPRYFLLFLNDVVVSTCQTNRFDVSEWNRQTLPNRPDCCEIFLIEDLKVFFLFQNGSMAKKEFGRMFGVRCTR